MTTRRRRRSASERAVKDRLIQARVPEQLEKELKREAKRRRLSVSHLVRNVLEDTLKLVDTVVSGAEEIVESSVGLAGQVARDATRIGTRGARFVVDGLDDEDDDYDLDDDEYDDDLEQNADVTPLVTPAPEPRTTTALAVKSTETPVGVPAEPADDPLGHVLAWNDVLTNRDVRCARCSSAISKGSRSYLGVTPTPGEPTWLCTLCIASL